MYTANRSKWCVYMHSLNPTICKLVSLSNAPYNYTCSKGYLIQLACIGFYPVQIQYMHPIYIIAIHACMHACMVQLYLMSGGMITDRAKYTNNYRAGMQELILLFQQILFHFIRISTGENIDPIFLTESHLYRVGDTGYIDIRLIGNSYMQ